jgi:Animal haem peroxidase
MRLTWRQRLAVWVGEALERVAPWHRLPRPLGLLCLIGIRIRLRFHNLYDPAPRRGPDAPPPGGARFPFGRNQPLWGAPHDTSAGLLDPSPRVISERLLARNGDFSAVPFLNLLAAAWLQFQVHDWIVHAKDPDPSRKIRVPLEPGDGWPERSDGHMVVARTGPSALPPTPGGPPVYDNADTHWWDASQVYGSTTAVRGSLREYAGGRLRLGEDGSLPVDPATGADLTGVSANWWTGLSVLHWLFAKEHNAICERLARAYPSLSDDDLYRVGRRVNAAVMAKIHTIEWTPAVLPHPTIRAAMRANWYGLFGPRGSRVLRRYTRRDALIGIPGSLHDDHGVPFSLTEEFVAVYRMHPLLPDEVRFVGARNGENLGARRMLELTGPAAQVVSKQVRAADLVTSLAVGRAGKIELGNYPDTLRNLPRGPADVALGDERVIDLATIDVLRDRERGVPRYNDFRRMLRMKPAGSLEELTGGDAAAAARLREVYGDDVERVDLMVGLYAERPPKGFGFSETAFRIFVLMASRRLKSDPAFTDLYQPEHYTREGLRWIEGRTMPKVLAEHLPTLRPLVEDVRNAFEPWDRPGNRVSGRTDPFPPADRPAVAP